MVEEEGQGKNDAGRLSSLGISIIRDDSITSDESYSDVNDNNDGDDDEYEYDEQMEEDDGREEWTDGDLRMLRALANALKAGKSHQYSTILKLLNRTEAECKRQIKKMKW